MPLNAAPQAGNGRPGEEDERASILVVDDLPDKLLVMRTVLEELGQDLVLVRSGAEALREVLHREFAVILLDVNMPDIDGLETAELIRRYRRSAHTPIIFVTAYADEMQAAAGYSLGAVDYILAPVVPEVLRGKVKVFVDLYKMQRRLQRQSEERLALVAAETARRAAEENTQRSMFLSQASRVLGDSLEQGVAAGRLLELLVPGIASYAALAFMDGDEPDETLQLCLLTPARERWRGERSLSAMPVPVQQALRLALASHEAVELEAAALAELGAGGGYVQGTVLPLVSAARTLGALLVAIEQAPCDRAMLNDLAERAAIAFENARLYRSLQAEIVERRQAELLLQDSNRRKDEFLAMLSHELRNPLAPIRNAVEIIRRVAPAEPLLTRASDVMDRQVRHLTRLVDELLDVARISRGKISLQMQPVDLLAVIAHSIETVRPFIDARHHTLALQLPDQAVWLRGDFARLSQVVANLLNNAAKYTEDGGTISVALSVDGGDALVTVRDNGIGIDPDLLPHVFELFEQGQRALDRSQGGLGVGLTLVRRIVELHHGRVEASSAGLGRGAEFRLTLPCLVEIAPETKAVPDVRGSAVGRCRVLVVDDNADAAESIAMFLAMAGHEVKTVTDGAQALACAPVYAPEVVVLDIGLPGIDGFEVARRLRKLPATASACMVALTGYGSKSDRERAAEAGFDRYFVKPADPQVLAEAIAQRRDGAAGGRVVREPGAGRP